ncbi:hypothetical protein [Serratia quinivorans]|uniref:hypothetical protein n=1 Tax=Serratia quinivorans TaxID=137545 RepID=UPI001C47C344|nr:hypothetical protein [Serratia quinivorans]MBV6693114.1 hypothetical protein [Serratia quinivorans]
MEHISLRAYRAHQAVVLTFLILFFFKSFITSGEFDSNFIDKEIVALNGLMLLYVGYSFFIATLLEKIIFSFFSLLFIMNIATGNGDYLFGVVFNISFLVLFRRLHLYHGCEIFVAAYFFSAIFMVAPYLLYSGSFVYFDERYGDRLTLGFHNPNTMAYYLFSLFTMALCLLDKSRFEKPARNLVAFIISLILTPILAYSYSRTYLVLSLLLLLLFLISPLFHLSPGTKTCRILMLSLLAFQFFSVILWGINPDIDALVNKALTGRIWFSWKMFQSLGPPNLLFGGNIESYKPIDFFYFAMSYSAGILSSSILLYIYYKLLGNMPELSVFMRWVVVFYLFTTLTETYFLVPVFNISLLLLYGQKNINTQLMR